MGIQTFLMPLRLRMVVSEAVPARWRVAMVSALGREKSGPCMGWSSSSG
jgi:hypothetical protein